MQDVFDIYTLIFLGLAVFVVIKLRSVLGQRTGFERPPEPVRPEHDRPGGDNVVPLPTAAAMGGMPQPPQAPAWQGVAEPGTPLAAGLDAIRAADPAFDANEFIAGAKAAYEMIVTAFAKGDRKTLKDLLAKDVFDGFSGAIAEREGRNETVSTTFVSIDRVELTEARTVGRTAHVTVHFGSKLITATRDPSGVVTDGNPEKVADVTDIWTFARDLSSRDPNWKLVATESGQ